MKNSKPTTFLFILFVLAVFGVSGQAQRQPDRIADRQVSVILQRLEQSSNRFRGSLNSALMKHVPKTISTRSRPLLRAPLISSGIGSLIARRERPMFRAFCKRHRWSMVS
jgi:hypothetical protein